MKSRVTLAMSVTVLALMFLVPNPTYAGQPKVNAASAAARSSAINDEQQRFEGERRYRTNCGRCHQAPHKYPPRMMATFVRHMRVRALITDEDMRFILKYMTQ